MYVCMYVCITYIYTYIYIDGGPCAMCAAGKYQDSPGGDACTACASGTFSLPGSNTSSACMLCPKGTFSPVAVSSCQQCAPGTYSAQMGATFCLICPTNSHSLAGSESLTSCGCNAGYVGSGVVGDRCEACPGPDFSCMDVLSVLKQAYRLYGICTHAYVHMYVCTCYVLTNPPIPFSRCKCFMFLRPV
jgi:hypothetical protein